MQVTAISQPSPSKNLTRKLASFHGKNSAQQPALTSHANVPAGPSHFETTIPPTTHAHENEPPVAKQVALTSVPLHVAAQSHEPSGVPLHVPSMQVFPPELDDDEPPVPPAPPVPIPPVPPDPPVESASMTTLPPQPSTPAKPSANAPTNTKLIRRMGSHASPEMLRE